MSRGTVRQTGAKASARRKGLGAYVLRVVISRRFISLFLLAAALGVVLFLREAIAKLVVEAFGLGILLPAGWLCAVAWIAWRRRFRKVLRCWNRWLGAALLSIAAFGMMGALHPALYVAGVSLEDVGLSGLLGQAVSTSPYGWAPVPGLTVAGIVAIAPRRSWRCATWVVRTVALLVAKALVLMLKTLRLFSGRLFRWLCHRLRLLGSGVVALSRRRAVATKTPAVRGESLASGGDVTAEPVSEVSQEVTEPVAAEATEEAVFRDHGGEVPPIAVLDEVTQPGFAQANNAEAARLIEEALASYGVEVKVQQVNPGPSVTQFGVEPGWDRKYRKVAEKDQGGKQKLDKDGTPKVHLEEVARTRVKVDRITSLANDLALALAVPHIRIEAPVPGKSLVGIEVPNINTSLVSLRSVIESPVFEKAKPRSRLLVALGQGAAGEPVVADLAKMPHLLIAGATGSGKTVCLNCIITCLLMQATPAEVRLILIDPKRVEMVTFSGVPHLMTEVVVETDKAVDALRRVTLEMDNRYRRFASLGVRNIDVYNRRAKGSETLPYVVVIIDELADLMMTAPEVVEPLVCRLAQLSRATGIHLVVATQRPSVDVITGLIKANFPTRISFAVVSAVDSRTILDATGAEKLLGRGDMLFMAPEARKPKRLRGCFVSDEEMDRVVAFWRTRAARDFPQGQDTTAREFSMLPVEQMASDPFLEKARQLANQHSRMSTSLLQRKLHIGYPRAARIMDQLEEEGLVESEDSEKPWEGEP